MLTKSLTRYYGLWISRLFSFIRHDSKICLLPFIRFAKTVESFKIGIACCSFYQTLTFHSNRPISECL